MTPETNRARHRKILAARQIVQHPLRHGRRSARDQHIAVVVQKLARNRHHMVRRLAQSEDHFRHAVAQRAMVIHLGEPEIFERQVPHALQRGIDIGRAARRLRAAHAADLLSSDKMVPVSRIQKPPHVSETSSADARHDPLRALRVRAALRADRRAAGVSRKRLYDPSRAAGGCVLWIVVAMVGARSAAMAFNRLVDADIDARNPRTKIRHIPAGLLSRGFCWGFTVAVQRCCFCSRPGN